MDSDTQVVEHKKFGKGVIVGFDRDLIKVKFGKETRSFEKQDIVLHYGLIHLSFSGRPPQNPHLNDCRRLPDISKHGLMISARPSVCTAALSGKR